MVWQLEQTPVTLAEEFPVTKRIKKPISTAVAEIATSF
jgi:hypothetical protein